MLKKKIVFSAMSVTCRLFGEVISTSIPEFCSFLGEKRYKELMQRLLIQEPSARLKAAQKWIYDHVPKFELEAFS